MNTERIEELKGEERVILAWIRDVTAGKQARLRRIRAELREVLAQEAANPERPEPNVDN